MKNTINLTKLFSFLLVFIFVGCTENIEIEKQSNEQMVAQNLKQFVFEYIKKSAEISTEFDKIPKSQRNVNYKNSLSNITNEHNFHQIMKSAGFSNSNAILKLLKERFDIENNFRIKNPTFYLYNVNKRLSMLTAEYDKAFENLYTSKNQYEVFSCASAYNTAVGRCNRDFGKCGITAVIAASGGFWPGLAVAVFCAWDLSDCKADASDDYEACV